MSDMMTFPATVEEFMEQYKIVDDEKVYTNGADLVPIFRMMQWFEHVSATDTISRQAAVDIAKDLIITINGYEQHNQAVNNYSAKIMQLSPAQPEPCEDAVSRAEVLRMIDCINDHQDITPYKSVGAVTEHLTRIASSLPPVTPKQQEYHEIGYRECADAVLKMWMDNVLTDGEHNRIIDNLNAKWAISEGDTE